MSIIKGVVLEKHNSFAIALTADGQFKKIVVKGNYELGEEVLGKEFKSRNGLYQRMVGGVAIAAAILLAILMPGILKEDKISSNTIIASDTTEKTVVAYVKVDINPSLQLGLNENLTVKEATPLNADGEQVLAQGDLTDMSVSSAMELVAERCYELGYINEDKANTVNLTYISKEKNSSKIDKSKLEQDIKGKFNKVMKENKIKGEVKELKEVNDENKENSNPKSKQNKEQNRQNSTTKKDLDSDSKTNSETKGKNNSDNSNKFKVDNDGIDKPNNKDKSNYKSKANNNDKDNSNRKNKDNSNEKNKSNLKGIQDNNGNNGNNGNHNKNLKDKTKVNSNNNGVGIKAPWYKIFELG